MLSLIQRNYCALLIFLLLVLVGTTPVFGQNTDPARWEAAMQRFDEQDQMHPPPEGRHRPDRQLQYCALE
jgi:hypothetical protein